MSSSRYSIVQYVPDPVTDERINIGVIVFDEAGIRTRFLRNWRRAGNFGGRDVGFLKAFARDVEAVAAPQSTLPLRGQETDGQALVATARKWINSIQLTEPRGSTLPADELIDTVARRFLRERVAIPRRGRDRRVATAATARSLEGALEATGITEPRRYIHTHMAVRGQRDEHVFDVAIKNGDARLGVLSISFELGTSPYLDREIKANAWAIDDVQAMQLPVTVVTLPPRRRAKAYVHAVRLFESLNAQVIEEAELPDWASSVATNISPTLAE